MKTIIAVIVMVTAVLGLWVTGVLNRFTPSPSSSSRSAVPESLPVAASTPAISDLGPMFRGRGTRTIPLVRLNPERNYEVRLELEDECRYSWSMTGVNKNWNLSGSAYGVGTAKGIVYFRYGGDFELRILANNQRCSWSVTFSYTVLPHTEVPDRSTTTTTSVSRDSSPSNGCSTDADCGSDPYGDERGFYGNDYWPEDESGNCYGDCTDMDNDGRTWNDVDADGDGCYESRGNSC